jgi:CheY-like chemotaxis protein
MPARNILIAEDEERVCAATKLLVEVAGHQAMAVMDRHAALRELAARPCDAVIIDMLMPEMDGVEWLNELRHQHTLLRISAISGDGHIPKESYLQIAHMSDAHALLPRPFNREQLERALSQAFGENKTLKVGNSR